ncbi:unnamed protein product [Symbiodinium sp. CCMP2592]|nr:unnamed protein product [Symbiodinium sp. CCMP2592]
MAPKAKGSAKAATHRAERRSVSPNPTKPSPKPRARASSEAPGRPTGDAEEPGPKVVEAELVPAWRNKTVQGLFCDPYIENTNLEGGRSSQALSDVIEIGTELLRSAPISMSSTEIQALSAALKQLGAAADRSNAGHDAFEAQAGMRWCQEMQKQIHALRADETWLVEGGWRGEHGSHAIMYMIQRISDSEFSFSVLNTGAGIHQFQVCDPSMMGIGKERLDLPFLYALPLVLSKSGFAEESGDAWPSTPQRAGTCYAKCIFLTLRVLLGHFGLGKDAQKKWMLNFRIGYLEKMVSDLQQSCHKLTISDRIILTVALKQVARRCAREAYALVVRGRVHVSLQKIWLAAPPMPWLGYFTAKMEAKEPALQLPKSSKSSGSGFQGFQLLVASALIPPEVRNAFAGPSATKSTNPHVDLTGIASASASGPSLDAVLQAALMCDRLEEVLGCSLRSKQLILGVVESLVFWEGQSLWHKDLGELKLAQCREVLAAIHRLGAHYLAGARSGFLGRCGSSTGLLVLASLLELFQRVLMATKDAKLAKACAKDSALWSLRPWQKDGRPPTFADLTAWMPMTSPAMLEVRNRLCRRQSASAGSESILHAMEDPSLLLFGPPEHQRSELSSAEAVGCGKAFAELVSKLVSVLGLKGMPTLPAVERPYQDWEVQVAWAFDPNLEAACPEWAQARDLSIFFQMLLSSVPALSQSLEGQGVAPAGDAPLSASSIAECGFSLSLFNPPSKLTVKVLHICTIAARHANFLYTQPSLAHPKVLCPSLPYLRFGGSLENEIASTPHLPDFDFSLTQAQAETLLMILNCPGPLGLQFPASKSPGKMLPPRLRIPMLLQFVVPNHVALLHHRQFQRIFFACLFEPGLFPKEPREEKTAFPPKVQSLREAKVPCLEPMAVEFGWLSTEMATKPQLILPFLHQLFDAVKDLGSGNSDGPLVQPFLFVLRVAVLVQDFVEVARRSAAGEALACLEEHSKIFRRFTQKLARKILARWIRQANVSKSLAESRTAWSASEPEADDVQSLAVASCTFSLWSEQIDAVATASGDEADTVQAVFSTLARQRVSLLRAVEVIDAQERDKCFSFILGGAMGVDAMPALTWRSAEHIPTVCKRVVETSHPINKDDLGKNAVRVVRLPKASRIIVRFDPLSQLDTGDFLKIYTKGSKGAKASQDNRVRCGVAHLCAQ